MARKRVYLTAQQLRERAVHLLAHYGNGTAEPENVYGTVTKHSEGFSRYNTEDVSIVISDAGFPDYWKMRAERENKHLILWADHEASELIGREHKLCA